MLLTYRFVFAGVFGILHLYFDDTSALLGAHYFGVEFEAETLFGEDFLQSLGNFLVDACSADAGQELDRGHFRAQSRPNRTQFQTDYTGTDDDKPLRHFFKWQGSSGRNDLLLVDLQWTKINKNHRSFIWVFTVIPGKGVTSDPVAIRMFLVLITSDEPSGFMAVTWFLPVILPWPLTRVTLFFLNNCTIPPVKAFTAASFWPIKLWRFKRMLSAAIVMKLSILEQ